MYSVYIEGAFCGHFKTEAEAFAKVQQSARPYPGTKWQIKDPHGKVCSEGKA